MADLKYRTGASATVTKSKSLEEKLAGIMGTSTGNIKKLESQLRREREAEEAQKKAEEEARKRAEAAAAANAVARAEADNKARLADLLTAANRAGVAQSSKNAKMVAFGEGETGAYTTKPTMTVREKSVKPNLPTLPTVNTPVATPPAKGDVKAVTLADEDVTADIDDVKGEINTLLASKNRKNETAVNAEIARLNDLLYAKEQVKQIEARNAEKREAADEAERQQQAELDRFQKYDAMDAGQMEDQIQDLKNRLQVVEDSIAANDRNALEAYQRGEMIEYNRYENERVRLTQMRDALEDELRALNDAYAQKAQFDQEYSAHDQMMMRNVGVAETRMDVAADAAQKNAAYIQAQGVKLGQLESKIKTFAGDPSSPEYAALINEYNVAADLYNQAVALSSRRDAQLVDSIGAYYDALDARNALDPVYQQSYEKAIGLTAQIDGLQRQLDELYLQQKAVAEAGNTGAAEVLNQQIGEIDEQIMALMKERAPLADYAYTYDMTRTLDELPKNDLYLFRSVASEDYSAFTAGVGNPEQARAQLLEKYSEKEFDRILGYVQRQYNAEKAAERQEKYEQLSSTFGGAVLATVASVVTNVIGAPGAVYEIVKQGLENSGTMTPYDTNAAGFWAQNATRGLRGAVSEQINNPVGEFVYQTLTSAIDSAAAMALAGASGGVLLGVSAAANSMQDIAERGGDLGQIVAGGVMAGVFEGLFEQYSIGNFYALKDVPTTTYRDMAQNILKSAGVNAQEEAATELANIMYDFIALGDASNYAIRLRELMTQDGLTEAQAKKALAMESATQIALAAASGALMGVGFGATGSVDSYIRVQRGEVVQPDDTEVFRSYMTTRTIAAAYLPADRRPNMSYVFGRTTQDDVEYYAQIVLDRMKEENRKAQQEREADRKAAQLRAEQEQERAEIKVRTLQTAAEVAETAVQAETSANTDAAQTQQESVTAAPVQQAETAAVMPQEVRNVRAVSNVQTAQKTPVSFDTDDVSAFVAEEAAEIYESLSIYEGTMLDSAVQDEARALRQEGREDVAAALEQMHREIGGITYGDSIGQGSEWDAGESAGGEAGTVAESAGSDQGRDVQTGREETGKAAREDYEAGRKIKLSAYGIRGVAENQTLTEITDTSSDPEIIEITNAAKLAGVEVHVVREQIRTKTGKRAGGTYENGVIVVSTSDPTFTPTQLFNHELFHAMRENTPGLLTETTQLLLDSYTDAEFDALVEAYQQLYAGLDLEDEDIFEEICADMYAGMVREQLAAAREAYLPTLTGEARQIVRERANVTAAGESDANGTRAGPELEAQIKELQDELAYLERKFDYAERDSLAGISEKIRETEKKLKALQDGTRAGPEKTKTAKTRFSMSSPVEQTDTLIALHNMDEEKLRRTLDLGAWPSPSIAIVEADQGHSNYGEYSAVFPRSTIDPEEDSRNRVYGSDAWTPTHSNARVEYEVNYDILRTFERDVESLAKQVADGVFSTSSVLRMMGVEDQTEYDLNEIAKLLAYKDAVKAAYLADRGEDVEIVYRKKTFDNFGNEALRSYVEKVGVQEAARLAAKMMTGERLSDDEVETAKDVIMEHWIASHERSLNAKPELRERRVANQREKLSNIRTEDFIRHAWYFYEDGDAVTDEIDRMATSNNLDGAVDTQDVQAWAKERLDGLLGEPGIYNGREFYDSRGNRRSFRDTHWEYSVENIVRAMNNADSRGENMFGVGASGLIAVATPEYGSVTQIHSDETRLRTVDKEEYDQIIENLNTKLERVVKDIMRSTEHHADNTFEETDIIETVIVQAAQGKRTNSAIKRVFAREGYAISDPQAKAVLDLLKEVAKVPTGYFEAKPQRVVSFEEAIAVVAPDSANKELLKEMRAAGMNVKTYRAGDENNRLAVINGLSGARFSISSDSTADLTAQLDEAERQIDELEALMGQNYDSTLLLQIDEAKAKRSAIYEELRERHARAARQAARENDEKRTAALEEIRLIEDHAKELSREASAERAAYKADGDAQHLANAERLRTEAAAERAKAKPMRERAGIEDKREFRPIESKRQTTNRILDLFKIQAGRRAEMRRDLNVILDRTLLQGYVTDSDLESLLHAMYDAGVDVVQPDAAYEDVAKTVRGTTLYISEEVRREFGDDWREMQRALTRAGIKTSLNSSERGVDSLYGELAEGYPGLFDSESTDMRAMLEDIVEAAQLGKAQHRSLADAAQEIGLSSDEDFAALYSEVRAELRSFADRADMEVRFRENLLKDTNERNAQRLQAERERYDAKLADLRKTYADSARRASERRQRSEQMTKIRNALKRLNRASERNDQTLTKILSRQTPEVQRLMNRVRDEISTVANRLTDRKLNNLLELKQLYEDRKANDPNFIPNPATEKALERVGMVHLNDLSVEDLQALYDTVTRIAHDFDEANQLIGEGMDQQLDNAGMEMIDEIEFAKGSSAKGNAALWLNERSLSPSRALLRYVGYDRSGIMGKLVESLEKGDIDAMGYTLGADMIFKEFVNRADVRKWLKTAAGENAEMIELEVPRILEWGEGDTPIFDQKNGEVIKDKVCLTKMMVVNMARDIKNEQNMWHVKYGGYTFPDAKLYKKGKLQEAYARSNSKAVRMSPEFVRQIVDEHLDKIGKEYVELLDQYYDQFSKDKVNGVSRQLDGVDKAISDSYNPIRTSKAFRAQNYNVFDGTIEGMGSLKNRQHFAGNPIVLADADETMRWHRDNMARYVGYAIPMRNFKALMNYSKNFGEETIRAQIETKYGANAGKFLDEFAKIIEEGRLSESEGFTALDKLTGKYVSRVLGFNISSMLKQLSALATAGTSHGFGVVNHALATPRKVDVELIRKYTPYYDYRGAGYTYTEVANLVRDTNAQQSKALQAILGKNWLEAADLWVNRRLWLAAEYVVQKRGLRPGTQAEIDAGRDPYYKAVAEVFNRMTHDTQTNYNTMSRPIALRSMNAVVRMATMFKTDALQLQGIARESFGAYQTAKRKFEDDPSSANRVELQRQKQKFINGAFGIVSASIMQSILEMVAKLVRGDDDDYRDENGKLTLGAAGKEVAKDTLYSLVGCVIFGDQIADIISALVTDEMLWEPDIPSVSALYDMYEDLRSFGEQAGEIIGTTIALRKNGGDADAYWRANWDVFAGKIIGTTRTLLSYMTGLALPNMEKTVLGLINHAFPQIPIQYSDYTGDFAKGDLTNLEGEALEAALHAYLTDEVGELGETAEAEILRLYELYGNKALPGANAPTSVKEVDENGNEIERKPTLEELGNWDVNYRMTFIDAMGDIIGSETYNALGDAEKLKLIARANEYARDMAKEAAGIPVDLKGWKLDAKEAFDAGAPLADAILFYTRASVLTSDVDEEGNTVANSKARKVLELLDDIDIPDSQKRQLLRGELSDKANADLDALLDAGYSFADAVGMLHDEFTGERDVDVLTGYLADGFSPESARTMYEAVEALEPEDGKKQVSNAQELAAIAASNIPEADKWTAFAGTFGADDTKALEKMEAVRAAGGTPDDYAELKANGQIDAYLRGVEAGFNPNTALRIVSAVAALPDLPEGESYDTSERQLAAVQACQTPEEQVKAYAMYGGADNAKTNEAKFTAALDFDVTPEMYLEARALAKSSYDADGNGSLKQDEVIAALEAMDLTDRQRAALFQLFGSSWKKNPYGNTATIRDAYAAAKE